MTPQRRSGRIAYSAVAYFSMLLLILVGCTTDTDTAAACDGPPSMELLYGAWSGHEDPIVDGDPLPIITAPGGGWISIIDLEVDNLGPAAEIDVSLLAPESGYMTGSVYHIALSETDMPCQHATMDLGSLYLFYYNWEDESPPPTVLGCADLTLSVRYEDLDGVVLEETVSLVGECDEMSADICGC